WRCARLGEVMKQNADRARGLNAAELQKEVKDSAEQMFRLRFQMSMGQMDGLNKVRKLRKERARMLTVLREREIDRVKSGKPAEPVAAAVEQAPVKKASAAKRFLGRIRGKKAE